MRAYAHAHAYTITPTRTGKKPQAPKTQKTQKTKKIKSPKKPSPKFKAQKTPHPKKWNYSSRTCVGESPIKLN